MSQKEKTGCTAEDKSPDLKAVFDSSIQARSARSVCNVRRQRSPSPRLQAAGRVSSGIARRICQKSRIDSHPLHGLLPAMLYRPAE